MHFSIIWESPAPRARFLIKTLLMTKLTAIFLIALNFQAFALGYGQTVTLSLKNASAKKVFKEVMRQTKFSIIYNEELLRHIRPIDIDIQDKPVSIALQQIFKDRPFDFKIDKNNIFISPRATNVNAHTTDNPEITQVAIEVRGRVVSGSGEPLANVSVIVKGTQTGVTTDANGDFRINVPDERAVLVFSYVGFISQEIAVNKQTIINITLQEENTELAEVVAVGYGTQRRVEITGAVAQVKAEDFTQGSVKDAAQLLSGKVAGLSIVTPSGDPSASSQILLRGVATINTNTQPLILIDGIPGDLNTVAPEDIESIDVLKDGSAAAIYGTRGTNGVILINTRRPNGRIEPTISYRGYVSTQEFVRVPKMLNAAQFRQKIAEGVAFDDQGFTTDWVKEISRKTPISHQHNMTFRGGNSKTNYLATLNYRQLEGVVLKSDYRTINSRVDVNHNMFDNKLKVNLNFINNDFKTGVNFSQSDEGLSDAESSNIFNQALYRNPTAPIRNPDGSWNEQTSISYYMNPLSLLNETYGGSQRQMTRISGSILYQPIHDLTLKALVSRSKTDLQSTMAHTKKHLSTIRDGLNGYARKSPFQGVEKLLELTAEYSKSFSDHKLTALAGYSYQKDESESSSMRNWNFPAGSFSYIDNIGAGQRAGLGGPNLMSSSKSAANLIGFFGRLRYNYREKYLLMANIRHEGSSRFLGTKKPWGTFPAVSAGWRISEEEFMSGIGFLNNLKLRAGYGVTGTAPDELFLGVSLLGYSGSSLINGQWVPGLTPISNPNPNLRWEEKKETNIGLDFELFNGRIGGSIDYYKRTTDGLLYDYSVPTPPNAYGTTKANVGIMENKGWEFLLNFIPVESTRFSWNSTVTFSTNRNKLVSLSNELYETTNPWFNAGYTGSPVQTFTHRVEVGLPIGNFYGYKVVDITDDGRWVYEDKDGKPSETKTQDDKKIIGNGLPKYYASWNNTLRYGRFDLNVTMRGAFGFQVLNYQRMYSENPGFTSYNLLSSAFDKVFGKTQLNKNVPVEYNSYYLEDADYWKIDNITFGYTFQAPKIKFLKSSRLYVSVLNAFILTGYKGMDPEVGSLGLTPGNDDRNKYPTTRVYSIGWDLTLH